MNSPEWLNCVNTAFTMWYLSMNFPDVMRFFITSDQIQIRAFPNVTIPSGEMAEWSKARDSKSRNPLKGFEGSNPSLSASLRVHTSFESFVLSLLL